MLRSLINRGTTGTAGYVRLVIGSAITALLVSLGTVAGMSLFRLEVNAAIPAALGAVAAATYAAATARRE
jgi:hypothetical protein